MKPTRQRLRADPTGTTAGFLLLEVLLAVFILAMSGFVLLEGLGRCVAAARSIQSYTVSDILLANKSYEYRQEPLKDNFSDQQGTFDDYPGYSWTRKLEGTDIEGMWQQTITVYWYEQEKKSASRSSSTGICPIKNIEYAITPSHRNTDRLHAAGSLAGRRRSRHAYHRRVQHVERGVDLLAARQRCQRSLSAATRRDGCADGTDAIRDLLCAFRRRCTPSSPPRTPVSATA